MSTTAGSAEQPANTCAYNAETAVLTQTLTYSSSTAAQHANHSTDSHTPSQSIASTKQRTLSDTRLVMYMLEFLGQYPGDRFAMTRTTWKRAVQQWRSQSHGYYFSLEWLLTSIPDEADPRRWLTADLLVPIPDEAELPVLLQVVLNSRGELSAESQVFALLMRHPFADIVDRNTWYRVRAACTSVNDYAKALIAEARGGSPTRT